MEFELFDWVFAIILVGAGILLLTGNGNILMGGAQGAAERKKLFDEKKMQRAFGIGFLLLGVANVVTIFVKSFAVSVGYLVFVVLVIGVEVFYVNKYCKK